MKQTCQILTVAKSSNECIGIHYIILFFSMFETFIIKGKVIKKKLLVKWEKCFFLTIINSWTDIYIQTEVSKILVYGTINTFSKSYHLDTLISFFRFILRWYFVQPLSSISIKSYKKESSEKGSNKEMRVRREGRRKK